MVVDEEVDSAPSVGSDDATDSDEGDDDAVEEVLVEEVEEVEKVDKGEALVASSEVDSTRSAVMRCCILSRLLFK